jgi:hypothetical protein
VPLVFNAATSSQFVGAGTLGAVHQLASRRVDVLLIAMHNSEMQVLSALQEQITDSTRKEASLGFTVDPAVFDDAVAFQQEIERLKDLAVSAVADQRTNFTNDLQEGTLRDFDAAMDQEFADFQDDFEAQVEAANAFAAQNALAESTLEAQDEFLSQNQNDAGEATASFGYFALGVDNAVQADIRQNPQGKFVGTDSPWTQVTDFLNDTLHGGGAFALIGLFISSLTDWMGNILDPSGNGSLSGFALILLAGGLIVSLLLLIPLQIVDLYRFFCARTGASKSEAAVATAIKQSFPLTSNDRL